MSDEFQPWRKFRPNSDASPHGWIQWKGTDVCMDFRCPCGAPTHVDASFVYFVRCSGCRKVYELSGFVEAREVPSSEMRNVGEHNIGIDEHRESAAQLKEAMN